MGLRKHSPPAAAAANCILDDRLTLFYARALLGRCSASKLIFDTSIGMLNSCADNKSERKRALAKQGDYS
jgi:hypothetical protein